MPGLADTLQAAVRTAIEGRLEREGLPSLVADLRAADPRAADDIEPNNARRVVRALEVTPCRSRSGRSSGSPQRSADHGMPAAWTVTRSPAGGSSSAAPTARGRLSWVMARR